MGRILEAGFLSERSEVRERENPLKVRSSTLIIAERIRKQNMRICKDCSAEFEHEQAGRGRPPAYCLSCREKRSQTHPKQSSAKSTRKTRIDKGTVKESSEGLTMERLICAECGNEWEREKARGKKPTLCPDCKKKQAVAPKVSQKRESTVAEEWEYISKMKEDFRCRCDLREGMTWDELLALGHGCTDGRYICGVLTRYREKVGWPSYQKKLPEELEIEMEA